MYRNWKTLCAIISSTGIAIAGCSTFFGSGDSDRTDNFANRKIASDVSVGPWLETAHGKLQIDPKNEKDIHDTVSGLLTKHKAGPALDITTERLVKYLEILQVPHEHLIKATTVMAATTAVRAKDIHQGPVGTYADQEVNDAGGASYEKVLPRLLQSSLEFLGCDLQAADAWECVEKKPIFTPDAKFRVEGAKEDFGAPVAAGPSLDMDPPYFARGWDGKTAPSVASVLAKKIQTDATKNLSMALYGIEDGNGSMKAVWTAINNKIDHDGNSGSVKVVFDIGAFDKPANQWELTLLDKQSNPDWALNPSNDPKLSAFNTHANFQYPEAAEMRPGTQDLIKKLNSDADGTYFTDLNKMNARLEWPIGHIMHNKFLIMEGQRTAGIWTGTTNLSNHCMGTEINSNMAIYIRNNEIAKAYLAEFNLMWDYGGQPNPDTWGGKFHNTKKPVSQRLFKFDDGTYVSLHFAPTDDGEHRAILPMLFSAQKGDKLRISMFGNSGYEIVRAIQYALAQGADATIILDDQQAAGNYSWVNAASANLFQPNPFNAAPAGKLLVLKNRWQGKNHYKAGTLTRASGVVEQFIVGSQNWSAGGNDGNDENMIGIMNKAKGVPAGVAFNDEFDHHMLTENKDKFSKITSSKPPKAAADNSSNRN